MSEAASFRAIAYSTARSCRDAVDTMKEHFGPRCFPPVRVTIKIKEAPAQSRTIFEYAPDSNSARDYQRVVDRLIDGAAPSRGSEAGEAHEAPQSATG